MTDPRYRGITRDQIPTAGKNGARIKVIAGRIDGTEGPVRDLSIRVEYFDVELAPGGAFEHHTKETLTAFAYVVEGMLDVQGSPIKKGQCVVFGKGDLVKVSTTKGARFLFATGEPLNEPVAWRGPIVMNTDEELDTAFKELREGTFVKAHETARVK